MRADSLIRYIAIAVLALGAQTASAGSRYGPASSEVFAAQSAINRVIIDLRREFEQSSDLHQAQVAQKTAAANYREAYSAAVAPVRKSKEYKLAAEAVQQLDRKLAWGRFDDHMNDREIEQTARALLAARQALSAMESKALSNNDALAAARLEMIDANGQLIALRQAFIQSIATNPRYVAARNRLEAARSRISRSRI